MRPRVLIPILSLLALLATSCTRSDPPPDGLAVEGRLEADALFCGWTTGGEEVTRTIQGGATADVAQEGDRFAGTLSIATDPVEGDPVEATYALDGRVGAWRPIDRWYELDGVVAERTVTTEPSPVLFAERMRDPDGPASSQLQHDGTIFVVLRSEPGAVSCHPDAGEDAYLLLTLSNA